MPEMSVDEFVRAQLQAGYSPDQVTAQLYGRGVRDATARPRFTLGRILQNALVMPVALCLLGIIVSGVVTSGQGRRAQSSAIMASAETQATGAPGTIAANQNVPAVLGVATDSARGRAIAEAATRSATAESSTSSGKVASESAALMKEKYIVAILGDSMVDTLQSHVPQLEEKLKARFKKEVKVYNYGVGSQNVAMGLARLDQPLEYKDRKYPSLAELKPDVVIVGSFAYNPFEVHDINHYWLTLAELVTKVQPSGAKVYLLADVAPVKETFAVGSLEWSTDIRSAHAQKIVDQLEATVGLATSLKLPLIDAYHPSQKKGSFGDGSFTNPGDGIHASDQGKELTIAKIAETISLE